VRFICRLFLDPSNLHSCSRSRSEKQQVKVKSSPVVYVRGWEKSGACMLQVRGTNS
jgi:hypothetical protein